MSTITTSGPQGSVFTLFNVILALNNCNGDFRNVFINRFLALLQEQNDETYVTSMAEYIRLIQSKYMFVRVERPRGSKHFVLGYVKCDWVFSFARRFEQMRVRLSRIPPVVLTKVEVEENKELRLACVGETDYERALAKHSDTRDEYGVMLTPLSAAIYGKDEESAMVLLDGGDDPNEVNGDGTNALHIAAEKGCRLPLFRRILGMIRNVNAGCGSRESRALMWAALYNHLDIVVSLMNHPGIDVNVQDDCNWTALHFAVFGNNPAIITQLLSKCRVDTTLKDACHGTPLSFAIKCGGGDSECVKILREHGAPEE
jgi:hypothetical protein